MSALSHTYVHVLADVSVAIVSLCSYSALDTPLTALSASNKVAYARRHGYRLFFETTVMDKTRPIPWSKVKASKSMTMCPSNPRDPLFVPSTRISQILALLKHLDAADWVMWMDCDSFFMHMDTPATALLAAVPPHANLVLSEDAAMINTGRTDMYGVRSVECGSLICSCGGRGCLLPGVMLVRSCEWSRAFLRRLYSREYAAFAHHPWWEQAALFHLLTAQVPLVRSGPDERVAPREVFLHTQRAMNSYPHELAGTLAGDHGQPLHGVCLCSLVFGVLAKAPCSHACCACVFVGCLGSCV